LGSSHVYTDVVTPRKADRWGVTNLREGTVVPDVTVVGEAVADETQTTLFDVLLDGVERLILGDLELGVGPTGDLDDHVEDAIALVGEERDVVEGGDDGPVLFGIDAMIWRGLVSGWTADVGESVRNVPKVFGAPTTWGANSGVR
jgi:hypothetical protein